MSAYTDADVDLALRHAWGSDLVPDSFGIGREDMADALRAVAPVIAARALREAASDYGTPGASATTSYVRGFLRDRADEIEAKP